MKINRHNIHIILTNFEQTGSEHALFSAKSEIRLALENIRGDLKQHDKEKYVRFHNWLDEKEMALLLDALTAYIQRNHKLGDMTVIDNCMVHLLMCQCLLSYELDSINNVDALREVVTAYFIALNRNLKLVSEQDADTPTSINIWLQHVISHPGLYLNHIFVSGNGNDYRLSLLNLDECGCVDLSHDRLLGDVRLQAEKRVLEICKQFQLAKPDSPVKILSLGPGQGLQEFILICKLFSMGIRNIELTLVETKYESLLDINAKKVNFWKENWKQDDAIPSEYYQSNQDELYNIIRALSLLSKSFTDASLSVYQYHSVSSLKSDHARSTSYDIIYAIDFEDYVAGNDDYADFHALADCLSINGTALVSRHFIVEEFISDRNKAETKFKQSALVEYKRPELTQNGYEYKRPMRDFFKV